jgi:phosphatidylglycerol lysyltransferase
VRYLRRQVSPDEVEIRRRVLALIKRHGWNSTSFQILEPGFHYWVDGDDACVGYVDTGSAWVVAGAPIAPEHRLAEVVARFCAAAAAQGRRVCCFGTEERFQQVVQWSALRIGDQPVWSPQQWDAVVRESKSLREQLRRARAKGVSVRALDVAELAPGHAIRGQLDALIARWLATKQIAPMGFVVQLDPFSFPDEKRYFIATRDDVIVGLLAVIPIYARDGWFFEDLLRDPSAPNGTTELMIDAAMRAAATSNVTHVTLGLAPLAGEVSPWLRFARRWGRALYDFEGLRAFKSKLKPRAWDPIYLSYPRSKSGILAVVDTLTAFARGGLLRFGIKTLLRGPSIVVRALAALLVAWTVLLALPASARWFPSPVWQWGWVAFDVVLGVALFMLAARWRHKLGTAVAIAVTADAVATGAEAVVYNAPRIGSLLDLAVIAIAIAAPTSAAVLLWHARAHRQVLDRPGRAPPNAADLAHASGRD